MLAFPSPGRPLRRRPRLARPGARARDRRRGARGSRASRCDVGPLELPVQAGQRPRLRHLREPRRGRPQEHRPRGRHPGRVVRQPDVLLHQPARALRPRRAGPASPSLCNALDFEMEVGVVLGRGGASLPRPRRRTRSSATRSSTTGPRATSSPARCRSASAPPRARTSPPRSAPGSSPPTSSRTYHDADGFLDLDCTAYVNGELIGHDRLSHMHWTFPQMIAYASPRLRRLAGDLLASGTTGGGGCLAELWGRNGVADAAAAPAGRRGVDRGRSTRRARRHRRGTTCLQRAGGTGSRWAQTGAVTDATRR